LTLANTVSYTKVAEDGMPGILRCICCEKEIERVLDAFVLPGRVPTYIGPCCRKGYEEQK